MSVMRRAPACICCAWLAVWSARAAAEGGSEDAWDADDSVGFGQAEEVPSNPYTTPSESLPVPVPETTPSPWSLTTTVRTQAAAWTSSSHPDHLAALRPSLDARLGFRQDPIAADSPIGLRLMAAGHLEYDFAYLVQPGAYDQATLDTYRWKFIGQELFAALRVSNFDLSVGRQIVNWGQGEVLSVLDVINPRDLREPGLADVADLRLAVLMTRASIAIDRHKLEFLVVHEPYFGLLPPPLGTFSPLRALLLESPQFANAFAGKDLSYQQTPGHDISDLQATQYHGRWSVSGDGFDLALQAASLLDPLGVPFLPDADAFAAQRIALPLIHPRYELIGQSGSVPMGAFLLRWEAALEWKRALAVRHTDTPVLDITSERRTRITGLLGLTYFASDSTTAALELSQSYVFDAPEHRVGASVETLWPVEKLQVALRLDYHFFRERAYLSALLLAIGLSLDAVVARAELGYAISDAWKVAVGAIVYAPKHEFGPFYGFATNDRVFVKLQWDLTLL